MTKAKKTRTKRGERRMDADSTSRGEPAAVHGSDAGRHAEDRIGELPDAVLHHILALVPTHVAVRTSTLSRRWRHLWASVPDLDFDRSGFQEVVRFTHFVERVLDLRRNLPVRRFRFSRPFGIAFARWLEYATGHGVQELELDVMSLEANGKTDCIFTCRSLEVLELQLSVPFRDIAVRVPELVCLARLRTVRLWGVTITHNALARLAANAPVLEDLHMSRCASDGYNMTLPTVRNLLLEDNSLMKPGPFSLNIEGPELRWLFLDFRDGDVPSSILVSVPRLMKFDYYGTRKMKSFVGELPSLSEAFVYIRLGPCLDSCGSGQIFKGLYNVSTLTLSMSAFKCLNKEPGYLPVFYNLKHLKILMNMRSKKDLNMDVIQVIMDLVRLSPDLAYLTIESGETVQLGACGESTGELELLELLCKAARARGCIATLSLT